MTNRGCPGCRHLRHGPDGLTCPAFPDGVPLRLFSGEVLHERVLPEQVGETVWEPDRDTAIRHYPGKHDQKTHGNWAKGAADATSATGDTGEFSAAGAAALGTQLRGLMAPGFTPKVDYETFGEYLRDLTVGDPLIADGALNFLTSSSSYSASNVALEARRRLGPQATPAEVLNQAVAIYTEQSPHLADRSAFIVFSPYIHELYPDKFFQFQTRFVKEVPGPPTAESQKIHVMRTIGADLTKAGVTYTSEALHFTHGDTDGEKIASYLVDAWANTSADHSVVSNNIQRAIAEELQVKGAWDGTSRLTKDLKARMDADWADNEVAYKAFARSVYTRTQTMLADAGITHLDLYRGVGNSNNAIGLSGGASGTHAVTIKLQPASSFTTSDFTAVEFARDNNWDNGAVMMVRVPAKQVYSTYLTGIGCAAEDEVVLLGGNINANATHWSNVKPTE